MWGYLMPGHAAGATRPAKCLVMGLTIALVAAGCSSGPPASHYGAVLDEIGVPDGWVLVDARLYGLDEGEPCDAFNSPSCPGASRRFDALVDMQAAYDHAKGSMADAGFAVTSTFAEPCELKQGGGPDCAFFAQRGSDEIYVTVFSSGLEAGFPTDGAAVSFTASLAEQQVSPSGRP